MTHLHVVHAGPATTVQDAGRLAWQHIGVSPAGFADPLLAALGNALLGNPQDAAVLEWTLAGDTLQVVDGPLRVAVAAWADVRVDGHRAPCFRTLRLQVGQVLALGALTSGRHGVLAVAGGIQTELVLGSRSVHARSGVGGRPLQTGDRLPTGDDAGAETVDRALPLTQVPLPSPVVRVLPSPQSHLFPPDALPTLLAQPWRVAVGDRMGLRLQGPPLRLLPDLELISEGVTTGVLQVPPSGQPIALGPDRQTMGGYAKIGVVISADLRHLAQRRDGEALRFALVDAAEAAQARRQADLQRAELIAGIRDASDILSFESARLLRLLSQ